MEYNVSFFHIKIHGKCSKVYPFWENFHNSNSFSGPKYCPYEYPYAVNDGLSCCKNYRKNQTACPNLGEFTEITDPIECCKFQEVIDCPNQFGGCIQHALADRKDFLNYQLVRIDHINAQQTSQLNLTLVNPVHACCFIDSLSKSWLSTQVKRHTHVLTYHLVNTLLPIQVNIPKISLISG